MIRFFKIILLVVLISYISIWFSNNRGFVYMSWFGYEVQASITFFLIFLIISGILLVVIFNIFSLVFGLPSFFSKKISKRKDEQNLKNLRLSYVALLSGDYKSAEKYGKSLKLDNGSNENLLIMQEVLNTTIKKHDGNLLEAEKGYKHLLENSETKFFATQGLLNSSFIQGDINKAILYAEEAYKQKPDFKEGAHSLLALYKKAEKWDEAIEFLKKYRRKTFFFPDKNNKFDADLELAEIYFEKASTIRKNKLLTDENIDEAYSFIKKSINLAPDNEDYLIFYTDICKILNKSGKAKSAIENFWNLRPSQKIADIYLSLFSGTTDAKDFKEKSKARKQLILLNPLGKEFLG